jgi:hypothetical protein
MEHRFLTVWGLAVQKSGFSCWSVADFIDAAIAGIPYSGQ